MRETVVAILLPVLALSVLPAPSRAAEPVRCYPAAEIFPGAVRTLVGDVDGDRIPDTVRTHVRWADAETCRARLVVITDMGALRAEIDANLDILIGPPGLAGLVRIDRRPGLEIAVVTWRGASTGFLELYGVRRGRLESLADRSFEYAGSVVNPSGVDCVSHRGASVVRSNAGYVLEDDRYHVQRHFYAFRAGTLEPLPRLTEHLTVRPDRLGRFPELASPTPFPSCTVVEGAS